MPALLSIHGRTGRLRYFAMELLFGTLAVLPFLAVWGGAAFEGASLAEMQARTGPIFGATILILAWPRFALNCRRARDAGLGLWLAASYVGLQVLVGLSVAFAQAHGKAELDPPALTSLALWAFWGILQFKGSVAIDVLDRDEVAAFGAGPTGSSPSRTIGSLSDDDLVRRAASLAPAAHAAPHVPSQPKGLASGSAPRGFGRRAQPVFGKR